MNAEAIFPTNGLKRVHVSVLAMDIVSYSRELDDTQQRLVDLLAKILNESLQICNVGQILRLPTGDGAMLVFPGEPVSKALEVAISVRRQIRERLIKLPIRMGIHAGVASIVSDLTGQMNVVGNAMNMCARIMDIGDDEHILLSDTAYEGLKSDERFYKYLSPLATNPVEVKHGINIEVYAYSDPLIGNACEPERLRRNVGIREASIGRQPDAWPTFLKTKSQLKIIDHSGPFFGVPQLLDRISDIVCKQETNVQILLLNPLSDACSVRSKATAYKSEDELDNTIGYTFRILRHLRREMESYGERALMRYDVRLFDAVPTFGGFITDDFAYVSIYVEHLSGSRGPFFSFARPHKKYTEVKSMYDCFEESFDALWTRRSVSIFAPDFLTLQQKLLETHRVEHDQRHVPTYM